MAAFHFDSKSAAEDHLRSKGFHRAYLNRWEKQAEDDGVPYTIQAHVVHIGTDATGMPFGPVQVQCMELSA